MMSALSRSVQRLLALLLLAMLASIGGCMREPDLPFQREYFWPGFSVPSRPHLSHSQRRKLDLIGTLVSLRHARAEDLIVQMLDAEDETCGFWMLSRLFQAAGNRADAVTRVLDRTRSPIARHREELTHCLKSLAEASSYWNLARKEPHRLLVALTTSLRDADEIEQRVSEYSGEEAAEEVILGWLAGMKEEEQGAGRLASLEKRVSPMARLDLCSRSSFLLRGILAAEDRSSILRRARSELSEELPEVLERQLDELSDRIDHMPMLRPFLARWQRRAQSSRQP